MYKEDASAMEEQKNDEVMEEQNRKRTMTLETAAGTTPRSNQLAIVPHSVAPFSPPPKRDPKRNKVQDGKDSDATPKNPLAGSFEGRRRGQ